MRKTVTNIERGSNFSCQLPTMASNWIFSLIVRKQHTLASPLAFCSCNGLGLCTLHLGMCDLRRECEKDRGGGETATLILAKFCLLLQKKKMLRPR